MTLMTFTRIVSKRSHEGESSSTSVYIANVRNFEEKKNKRERNICAGRVFISYDTMIPPRLHDDNRVDLASRDD